ncbi:MAG TPA: 2-dehydropantoate 2-reductase N-terminal domain-containing protein [Clostridia bacterium]|nr:2-dehydropantoate 2-reductase N-terminal domain-containing protein [Clostridia bacterium]
MDKVLVLGAGVMGTALAVYLAENNRAVNLWGTKWDKEILTQMEQTRKNKALEKDIPKNVNLFYEEELEEAFEDISLIVIAVSTKGIESVSKALGPYLKENHMILSVTKGIDEEHLYTMSDVIKKALPERLRDKVDIIKLGGPIIAKEIANGKYTEGIFASKNIEAARYARYIFHSSKFKGNTTTDIEGVELCAAFKNPYAIAVGIVQGMEGGMNNSKAALMARGTIEMANILEAYGSSRETALGLAGIGDYYVTSQGGRNGIFGSLLGKGKTVEEALEIMDYQTVEGLATTLSGYKLLKKLEKEKNFDIKDKAFLFNELYDVLYKGKDVKKAMSNYWGS